MAKIHLAILIVHLTRFSVPLHLKPHTLEQTPPAEMAEPVPASLNLDQLRNDLETMVNPVQEKLVALEAQFSQMAQTPAAATVDPSVVEGLQTQVQAFNAQVEASLMELSQKMAEMPNIIQAVVQEHLQYQPSQTESIDSLKHQIQTLEKRLEEVASQSAGNALIDSDDLDFDALLSELA